MPRCTTCGRRVSRAERACPRDGQIVPHEEEIQVADEVPTLPGYHIEGVLGRGGFGTVVRARRRSDGEGFAIKIARADVSGAARRLESELDALIEVGRPHVPGVEERGRLQGRSFGVLEFVEGPTLGQVLEQAGGPVPFTTFVRIAKALLAPVAAVHARSIAHLDLKPENFILLGSPPGQAARLIDFGLARQVPAHADLLVGTAEYMSPEQCETGALGPMIDTRADVYALGVIFFEMLTGATPFFGRAAEVREAQRSLRPPRLPPGLPVTLDALVTRCLAKDPAARPLDVDSIRRAIEAAETEFRPSVARMLAADPANKEKARPAVGPPSLNRDKRTVGLVFFETTQRAVAVQTLLASMQGQLAQQAGSKCVGVFGHEVGDNPARTAILAADALLARGVARNVVVDVSSVMVQLRQDGGLRFFSAIFGRADRYPGKSDPSGILLTTEAARVVPELQSHELERGLHLLEIAAELEPSTRVGRARMVGRDHVLQRLLGDVHRTIDGALGPALVQVIGEASYGKSHLAATLAERIGARRTSLVSARQGFGGGGHAFLRRLLRLTLQPAVGELPRGILADGGAARLEPMLGEPWIGAAMVLGWMADDHPALRRLAAAPGALRSAVARAVGESLRIFARRAPFALLVDDAQMIDEVGLDALEYATLSEAAAPLWVATFSREPLRPRFGARARRNATERLEVLSTAEAEALIRELLRPAEAVPNWAIQALHERTQGVPGLLVALIDGLKRDGLVRPQERGSEHYIATEVLDHLPDLPIVEWSARREIEALPAQLSAHARAASVFGRRVMLEELSGTIDRLDRDGGAQLVELDAAVGLSRLVAAGLMRRSREGAFEFRNSLVRDILYQLLPERERARLHRAVYEVLRERAGSSLDSASFDQLAALAHHAGRSIDASGEQASEAVRLHLLLAERSDRRQTYELSERTYDAVLGWIKPAEALYPTTLRGRGISRFRLGRLDAAVRDLDEAASAARAAERAALATECLLDEAMVLDWLCEFERSARKVEEAYALYGTLERLASHSISTLLRARTTLAQGLVLHRAGDVPAATQTLLEAAELAEAAGDEGYETLVIALLLAGPNFATLDRLKEAESTLARAVAAAERREDRHHLASALNNRALVWLGRCDAENLIRDFTRVLEIARDTGFVLLEPPVLYNLGESYYVLGRLQEAEEHARRSLESHERIGSNDLSIVITEILLARIALYARQPRVAAEWIEAIDRRLARVTGSETLAGTDAIMLEAVRLAAASASREQFYELLARGKAMYLVAYEVLDVLELEAVVAEGQGDRDRAIAVLSEAREIAQSTPTLIGDRVERHWSSVV